MEQPPDTLTGLQRVISVVSARDDRVGHPKFADSIIAAARALLREELRARSEPVDPAREQYVRDFCAFVLQDFPAVLRQPFHKLSLKRDFEEGDQQIDAAYEHQDAWAAKWLFTFRPDFFVDIGSRVCFVAIVSRLIRCIAIDARPTRLRMDNLEYRVGEGQSLPFEDESVPALTCLHAVEHFGLGRYGDTVDNTGWVKAFEEFRRVVMPGGWLFVSVPVWRVPTVAFHIQHIFDPEIIKDQFAGWGLHDEQFLCPGPVSHEEYMRLTAPLQSYGTYCALFQKPD
ncbi:methyltransferase domain-containing protein [Candidatus Poribacteria bacterium]|jgi:hypothetical protein|nr:methyltransferase domain-containing protein [Candidatus Poribacteria bacterium]MBT5533344.1 methyltransferase domain-containing protein [Candidatus Poribacteria bacterium]MBT5711395.1 methyltransferase domain-containing protein [Candidatus Poribacteria bacterium]MBT7099418.1 methyltransferase domain-containing protein [Candidatus Poribacteria bacterium]MBT7804280.1 methyltransferase domain-containing protein [Candidatus Poribacteria bacterium]